MAHMVLGRSSGGGGGSCWTSSITLTYTWTSPKPMESSCSGGIGGGESGMSNHAVPGGMFPSSSMKQNLQNSSEYRTSFFLGDGGDTLVLRPSNRRRVTSGSAKAALGGDDGGTGTTSLAALAALLRLGSASAS
jgi:hypothetical protein